MTIVYSQFRQYYSELQHVKRTVTSKQELLDYLRNRDCKVSENLLPPCCLSWVEELASEGLIAKTFKYNTVYYMALDDNLSEYSED